MTRDNIRQAFWNDISATVRTFHLGIDQECRDRLEELINQGADRVLDEMPRFNLRKYGQAEENLFLFVGAMVYQARLDGSSALEVSTFKAVKRTFCPLWPFC